MTETELNIGEIIKFDMRKDRVRKGHKYAFGVLITKICRSAGVLEETLDYLAPICPAVIDVTRMKRSDME